MYCKYRSIRSVGCIRIQYDGFFVHLWTIFDSLVSVFPSSNWDGLMTTTTLKTVTVSREQLYPQVWATPMQKLARRNPARIKGLLRSVVAQVITNEPQATISCASSWAAGFFCDNWGQPQQNIRYDSATVGLRGADEPLHYLRTD